MSQSYGVLRVVRVRPPANATENRQEKYPTGWLPEERLVHLLTRLQTTIGRALNNDIILMNPTVSREHALLILDQAGWHIVNLTAKNIVRVNGQSVPSGGSLPVHPQDVLVLGSTMLQLIAPSTGEAPDEIMEQLPIARLLEQSKVIPASAREPLQRVPPPLLLPSIQVSPSNIIPTGLQDGRADHADRAGQALLPVQPDPEVMPQPWEDNEAEGVLGAGVTMQFALPQRMGVRTRWLIAGTAGIILAISAVVTIVLNSLIGLSALAHDGISSLVVALTVPLLPALGIALLVNFLDRFEREPWFLRLAAFLWGAIIAIPPALFIEQYIDAALQNIDANSDILRSLLQGLNAGVTEETIKGLGLLLLFLLLRDEFDNVTDGIVYSALIGAGFAMVENFGYFAINSKKFLLFLIVGRIVLGWLGHSTFIACFGAALGYVRHTKVRWKQIVVPLVGYLLAVGLHTFYDFVDFQASAAVRAAPGNSQVAFLSLVAVIGDYIPPFAAQMALLYILIKSLAHEAAVIREFLAVEVSNGVVTVGEYALLQNSFQRTREERRVLWRSGLKQWLRVKALYQTEIGLAFRKWHVSMGDKPKLGYLQPEDAYRQRIKRLRNEIKAEEAKVGRR